MLYFSKTFDNIYVNFKDHMLRTIGILKNLNSLSIIHSLSMRYT